MELLALSSDDFSAGFVEPFGIKFNLGRPEVDGLAGGKPLSCPRLSEYLSSRGRSPRKPPSRPPKK